MSCRITDLKGYDLLFGGSPCTYWSVARKNREITKDGEGFKLFMEYVRALEESECRYFLYENNYSIHQNIKGEISKMLDVDPIMINSALVSAQNRKRCYRTNIPNVHQPEDKGIWLIDILESGV
ncbi:MAG: DNA cytosine methyltransferase [Clostridium sp.]|nr:DNA cytosine methyltransferase [Clostridium sp.]